MDMAVFIIVMYDRKLNIFFPTSDNEPSLHNALLVLHNTYLAACLVGVSRGLKFETKQKIKQTCRNILKIKISIAIKVILIKKI